ncbi:MAG: glycine cleavage system aminomethyltransferase GcvT [Candidatus Pacebacteria bacterium]|nr:glycine cleavage system aminomethyltransferase GcvT [Candidatus Paceibacterota bacterium]
MTQVFSPRRHTPYYHQQISLGAEMADRIGYDAAVKFTSTANEHLATRKTAGQYDVYHQVIVEVKGHDAEKLLNHALVNDVSKMKPGRALYSSVCNAQGGMVDDLICYKVADDFYRLCPTPSRVDIIVAYLSEKARTDGLNAYVTNLGIGRAFISVQGPKAREILQPLCDVDISNSALPYYGFTHGRVAGVADAMISRTGYSGELGFEVFYAGEYAHSVFAIVANAGRPFGMEPAGLGALRSVRIEKKYPLYGLDLNETTSPLEAGLGWTVRFDKTGGFVGREALIKQRDQGVTRQLVAMVLPDLSHLPTIGDGIEVGNRSVGSVTSSDYGHYLGKSIAMGYVATDAAVDGAAVTLKGKDGKQVAAVVTLKAPLDPDMTRIKV